MNCVCLLWTDSFPTVLFTICIISDYHTHLLHTHTNTHTDWSSLTIPFSWDHSSTRILGPFTLRNRNNLRFALCSSPEDYTQTLFTPGSRWAFYLLTTWDEPTACVGEVETSPRSLLRMACAADHRDLWHCDRHVLQPPQLHAGICIIPPVGRLSPATVRPPLGTKRRRLTFVALSSRCANAGVCENVTRSWMNVSDLWL